MESTTLAAPPATNPLSTPRPKPTDLVAEVRRRIAVTTNVDDQTTLLLTGLELLRRRQRIQSRGAGR